MNRARAVVIAFALSLAAAWAQEFRATLAGRVTDSSEAAVPSATLEIRNIQTNEVFRAVTGPQGDYSALLLRPGTYSISTQVAGFKKYTREGLLLTVGQTVTVNILLEVGNVTEQVTVTAETPLLETSKADRGGLIDNQQVAEFPLNARNPFMLSMLVSGVSYNGTAIWSRPFDNGAIADWSINGSQNRNNEFLLDGAPNNSQAGGNNIALVPTVDAVQEFKIQTNSYDAQYGHSGGGIVNVTLKSGTNRLHGSIYEFARRNGWDANSFQNNARGAPREGHYLDQYGIEADGPIYIPKVVNGRNKAFYMFNWEGYREGNPLPLNLSVPEPEMRNGDFSKLVDAQKRLITIYNPTSGRMVNNVWTRDPFPGNVIPSNRINPIARKILDYVPLPNTSTPNVDYSSYNRFVAGGDQVQIENFYNLAAKFDFNLTDRHRMFFRHANNNRRLERTDNGLKHVPGHQGYYPHTRVNWAEVVDWVSTLRPTLVLNVRVSFNRFVEANLMGGNDNFDITTLGLPKSLAAQLPNGDWFGHYEFSGYMGLGRYPSTNNTNNVVFLPNLSWLKAAHSLKAGLDARWIQYSTQNYGNPFYLTADRGFTQKDYNRGDALSGNSIATWLLGTPSTGSSDNNLFPIFLYKYYAPWVQDDWKLTRRLTLNLGLRWDFNVPANERYNRMNRGFDKSVVNPADKLIDRTQFPGFPTLRGGLLFASTGSQPRVAADIYKRAVQPRAGAAFQVGGKLVLRGGWGRYYINPSNDYLQTYGFSLSTPLVASLDNNMTPIPNLINNPFPNGIQVPGGSSLGAATYLGRGFNYVNPSFRLPLVDQFSFGFQQELPWRSKLEASYVGSRTRGLQTSKSLNAYDLAFRQSCNLMEGGNPLYCDQQLPNPFKGLEPFRGTSLFTANTLTRATLALPYSHFGGITELTRNDGALWFNSMQVTLETRGQGGLNLLASYSLSKMIEQTGFNDVQRSIMQRSVYTWDRPHRLTVAAIYQLPLGKGKRWLNGTNRFWQRIAGGWENSWLMTWMSGRPWELPSNVLYVKEAKLDNIAWSGPRVYGVRPCVARWNDNGTITMQAFSVQAGCVDYNFLILPRYAPRLTPYRDGRLRLHAVPQFDLSINKTTAITERTRLQFRFETFNAFNTYYFYNALFNNNPDSATFGSLDKASVATTNTNNPRYIQLAVKFLW
jgi:hypothetical protein